MKPLVACLAALALALSLGLSEPGANAHPRIPAVTGHQLMAPAAPAKKTPKPKPSASPTATPNPSPSLRPSRSDAEIEGDRWVQIAVIAGGGLLGSVLVFFAIGALMRRKGRRR